jgi:hypothetical protein
MHDRVSVLLLLLHFVGVFSKPPTLTSLTYRRIDDLPTPNLWETMSMAVVTATFDQDITYRDQSCPGPRIRAQISPCTVPTARGTELS